MGTDKNQTTAVLVGIEPTTFRYAPESLSDTLTARCSTR